MAVLIGKYRSLDRKLCLFEPLASDGAVSRHRLRRHLEVAVTPIQEAFPPLGQRLENEARARRGTAATAGAAVQSRGAIFHVETQFVPDHRPSPATPPIFPTQRFRHAEPLHPRGTA